MAVRRQASRLAAVCVMLGGLTALGAAPAVAAGDSVRVRATDSFRPGGSPGAVTVAVRKGTGGCAVVRTGLGLRLAGLAAEQVSVEVASAGRWVPVAVSGGGGAVAVNRVTPSNPALCKGKSLAVRYRVAFRPGAPGGRLEVIGEATNARGRAIGRDATAARVVGQSKRPTPSPTPTRRPTPSPTVAPTEGVRTDDAPLAAVAAQASTGGTLAAAEDSGGLPVFMLVGIGLFVVGAGLIVLLVRRSRADREPADDDPGAYRPVPRNPGGTTYRSGGQPPAPPASGVYGRPAAPGSGAVYGARPGPAAPPGAGGYGGGPPRPPAPGPGGPGQPPAGGGDATTIMPRLPD
ncbi:hypothetical protein [Micromonospora sp. DT233]|uniref:hypothetical protein n=1 Tax=Micromonospora sp. DT233 TaxID=3393432 RepID=UPI003CF3818E